MLEEDFIIFPGEVSEKVLVVGGGVAGIQASLDIANLGYEVVLVERDSSLGGRVARLSATYPNLDHPVCLLREIMVQVWGHPRVTVLTNARIECLEGFAGCFEASIRVKSRRVQESTCNGCGRCWRACPVRVDSEFDLGLGKRSAVYVPFPQAVPSVPTIDEHNCLRLSGEGCSACIDACPRGSIDFEQPDSELNDKFGAVVLAVGLNAFDPAPHAEIGLGRYPDVINSMQFERMLASAGPTKGEVVRPSDGSRPKSVAFVCCARSGGRSVGRPNCSKVCGPNVDKQVALYTRLYSDARSYVFYTDNTSSGKGMEELARLAREGCCATYIHGRVVQIVPVGQRLLVRAESAAPGRDVEKEVDLVVLAVGLEAYPDTSSLAGNLGVMCDENGFITEAQPQFQPVETSARGVFVAGSASGPKDIGETVAQGSAVSVKVVQFLRMLASRSASSEELGSPDAEWSPGLL